MSKEAVKNEKGARLRVALSEKYITPTELARLTGKSRQQVNTWLSYGRYSYRTLDLILNKIGMARSTFYRLKVRANSMSKEAVKNEKGARLRVALSEKYITPTELARLTGKSRQQVNTWLSYGRYSYRTLDLILNKIGMAHSTFYRLKV